jgi:putative FmdB family regulatory protein
MPIYDYECKSCGESFDALRRLSDDDHTVECPYCHEKNAERKMSLSGLDTLGKGGSGCGGGGRRGSMRFG